MVFSTGIPDGLEEEIGIVCLAHPVKKISAIKRQTEIKNFMYFALVIKLPFEMLLG
jgi:hypothetical protein